MQGWQIGGPESGRYGVAGEKCKEWAVRDEFEASISNGSAEGRNLVSKGSGHGGLEKV